MRPTTALRTRRASDAMDAALDAAARLRLAPGPAPEAAATSSDPELRLVRGARTAGPSPERIADLRELARRWNALTSNTDRAKDA